MWEQEFTDELIDLYNQYRSMFGCEPDNYDDYDMNMFEYHEYVTVIKASIINHTEVPITLGG
mgnify:CR=1 FL=1